MKITALNYLEIELQQSSNDKRTSKYPFLDYNDFECNFMRIISFKKIDTVPFLDDHLKEVLQLQQQQQQQHVYININNIRTI